MLSLQDSLCCSTLRVLGWNHCKNSALHSTSYGRTYTNQISMVCKWHATFFLQKTDSVNSKTPIWPTYMSLAKAASKSLKECKGTKNHLTWMPSNSLCPQERLCSEDSVCPQGWESQGTDWQRCRTLSSYLALWDARSFFPSRGICFRCYQEKGSLQGPRQSPWSLCGAWMRNLLGILQNSVIIPISDIFIAWILIGVLFFWS